MNNTTRVSDIISIDDIKSWNQNDTITIKAGTGVGKSYFIKNKLYEYAKLNNQKILFLIHRRDCKDQFIHELNKSNKSNTIDVITYQLIESLYRRGQEFDFSKYSYIVSDEFHYFISESAYNKTTDISLNEILKQSHAIKIMMSATGDYVKGYINHCKGIPTIDYELDISYGFIESLNFYDKPNSIYSIIDDILERGEKAIVFIQSAKEAYKVSRIYKEHSIFNCSRHNRDYGEDVDEPLIKEVLINERFDKPLLITTTTMDAGVNIVDEELRNVIVDVRNVGSLIQCIGRKRLQNKSDKINLYIKNINNNELGGMLGRTKTKLGMAEYFKSHTVEEYIDKYNRETHNTDMVYDVKVEGTNNITKKLNELMYFKNKIDICEFKSMLDYGSDGYKKFMSNLFNISKYKTIEKVKNMSKLERYLDSIAGKRLYGKEDKNTLAEMVGLKNGKNNRLVKSFKVIAPHIKDIYNSKYILESEVDWRRSLKDGSTNHNRGKGYWIIFKDENA